MSQRISHSVIDPVVGPALRSIYPVLRIPNWFPPEGIVLIGHLCAIAGAVGFAFSLTHWWGGILAACGVLLNHVADCIDGTHARRTNQCRHGGELLDHFTDPLSFAYWLIGIAIACNQLPWGMAALVVLFAHAVLTNIKAKLIDRFELGAFGPSEFKTLLFLSGLALSIASPTLGLTSSTAGLLWGYRALVVFGGISLIVQLIQSVREVNQSSREIDTTEWVTRGE